MTQIHPTAIVDKKARLGENVSVGAYSIVGPDVALGDGCVIHNHVTVTGCTTLGKSVQVFQGAVLGNPPQDLKYKGERTLLRVGDDTVIRECCTLNIGTELGGGETLVGSNNWIMSYVHIAHDCKLQNNIVIANGAQLAGHVHVDEGARISGLVAIHHFVTVGCCSFVAGSAKLSIDVPPFTLAEGHPAKIRVLNLEGIKRRGISPEALEGLKEAFRLFFGKRAAQEDAFLQLAQSGMDKHPEVAIFVEFIKATARGRHGRALEAAREVVPPSERDGRLNFRIGGQDADEEPQGDDESDGAK